MVCSVRHLSELADIGNASDLRKRVTLLGLAAMLWAISVWCHAANAPVTAVRPKLNASTPAESPLQIAIAFDPVDGNVNSVAAASGLEKELTNALNAPVHVVSSRSLQSIAAGARAGQFDALWVVSPIAVAAAKNEKYEIVGFDGQSSPMALLVAPNIAKVDDLKGRYVYLPQEGSPASVAGLALMKGHGLKQNEWLSAAGDGTYEVGPFALESNLTSGTVVPEAIAQRWLETHGNKGWIIERSPPVPGQTLVVRKDLAPNKKRQLADWAAGKASIPALIAPSGNTFNYLVGLSR